MQLGHSNRRPRFRGVSHAFGAVASVAGAVLLWQASVGDPGKQVSMMVFAASLIGLYTSSATYHLGEWSGKLYGFFRRLDHSMIFVLIAGTYTPFCVHALEGSARLTMLSLAWGAALGGVATKLLFPRLPRWVTVPLYLAVSYIALVDIEGLAAGLRPAAMGLVVLGGVSYTVGAIIYGLRRPNPVPGVFGYHEVFHLLVIAGSLSHFLALLYFVAPVARV
ncbi:MAG: hemolysin III family protein [Deltaproteobacteria bacterium]|nr:hemolysin III family protein [Deltaproteobacteria bacterium]